MATKICKVFVQRNSSILFSPSNHSHISDVEWITNTVTSIIFIFAFIGNTAALIVMFGSRGPIRLTNNKYLANLACADLLRACFMPFTIIARMKRNFIFGKMICKILPIVQGLSVAVDVFTLVCISVERYLAICRPLLILRLQSIRFSNLLNSCILFLIWLLSLLIALPNLYMYSLCSLPKPGRFKCEKISPQEFDEKLYMIILDVFYFVIPIVAMIVLYALIIRKMYRNSTAVQMRSFRNSSSHRILSNSASAQVIPFNKFSRCQSANADFIANQQREPSILKRFVRQFSVPNSQRSRTAFTDEDHAQYLELDISSKKGPSNQIYETPQYVSQEDHLQNNNLTTVAQRFYSQPNNSLHRFSTSQGTYRMDRNRRKALKILIVLIMEFFICWTPLFIYHTIGTFDKKFYRSMPNILLDLIILFSFASALCNPLTYYFMSKRYRSALYAYLRCCYKKCDRQTYINGKRHYIPAKSSVVIRSNQKEYTLELEAKNQLEIDIHHHQQRLRTKTC